MGSLLQKTPCLKATNSLRTQLLWSFGTITFVSLLVVVVTACTSASLAGKTVSDHAEQLMREQVTENLVTSSRLVAEQLDSYMIDMEGTIQLVVEAVKDRIVGYPYPGWETDRFVPFLDADSERRVYPLNHPPPPMEWNITRNVYPENLIENVQERAPWVELVPSMSTSTGGYFMQGACDPSEKNVSAQTFYPNCTAANNNFETGGIIHPTPTNNGLYEKSGDLTVFLKALWESQKDALMIGIYFHNSGAGSQVLFPGFHWPGTNDTSLYTSAGCDWMKTINPYTGRPLATPEEIARCHPMGALVPQREYNAMERPWCKDFALQPDSVGWYGPYRSLDTSSGVVVMTVGKSVFDRRSGEFIGCVGIDISVDDFSKHLNSSAINEHSELLLVRFGDGSLVGNSLHSNILRHNKPVSIADLGYDAVPFKAFQGSVDFEKTWTAEEAEESFLSIALPCRSGLMTAYPIPVIPEKYNPSYRPRFLVLHSIGSGVFDVVESINSSIDQGVQQICITAGCLAVLGMALVLLIVWCVARKLTRPLLWMEGVAWRIVNHTDVCSDDALAVKMAEDEKLSTIGCTPKTEVNELVSEFKTMIKGFSGEGASEVADAVLHEIQNDLTWQSDFQQLYSPHRPKNSFRSTSVNSDATLGDSSSIAHGILQGPLDEKEKHGTEESLALIVPAPVKRNRGHVICTPENVMKKSEKPSNPIPTCHSRLFWWIVILIVIPLLLIIGLICGVVSHRVSSVIPSMVDSADRASGELALEALNHTASSKAFLMSAILFDATRDLHLMTRVAGWLYFGGVKRSPAFTAMDTACEECKLYEPNTCPFYNSSRAPCPCEWDDLLAQNCTSYNSTQSRNLQRQFWGLQSQDADPNTGRRSNSSSFPTVGSSPNTTQWWYNASLLPGYENRDELTASATSYDRLRTVSAMAVVKFPVYNYAQGLGWRNRVLGVYSAFEEDGLFTGFNGCEYTHASYAFWESTEENGAALVAPLLCPIGKHGYDPRCRDWYATGRSYYNSSATPVHVTAPYQFANQNEIAASATAPIANPRTGEYLGQTLLDFFPEGVKSGLDRLGDIVSIVITPNADATGGDTVVGPNKSSGWESASILDLLFEYDDAGSINRDQFEQTSLLPMKNGSSGLNDFNRTREDGSSEHLIISYAPVYERVLLPVSPDDFSRGAEVSHVLLYSVGIIRTADEINAPFETIEDDIQNDLRSIQTVYIAVTIVVAVLFTAFTCIITLYTVTPMITLLGEVQNINNRIEKDFAPMKGGSREVRGVYNTFAKLYKIVRISNTAFFSGNLKWAYHFVNEALQLFQKVNDQKAVSIACNNLGNTLFAAYYDEVEDIGLDGLGSDSLIPLALCHYGEAIERGELDFDGAPVSELKAKFALQLADRIFNRGLFLLLIQGDDLAPTDARQQAFADIRRARSLDYDVKDYMLKHKLLLKNSSAYFSRLLRRINGLVDFNDDVGLKEVWDVKELIQDADRLLFAAWNEPTAPLFKEVNRVGRLQQLEAAAILFWLSMGNEFEASRLAMRMFSEDEYILESPFARSADALLRLFRGENERLSFSRKTITCAQDNLRRMAKSCKNISFDIGKCLVFALELTDSWSGDPILEKINACCLSLYDCHCMANDYMGIVAYSTRESFTVELGKKDGNEGRQRTLLDLSTTATTEQATPAFPLAIQMVIDSHASLVNDSYLVLILDGKAWNSETCSSLGSQVDRLNRERSTWIHLFIIGLDVGDEAVREQCKNSCSVSKQSMYFDATLDTIDEIFDSITLAIVGRRVHDGFLKGVTMERF